jgi:hypothetical protein
MTIGIENPQLEKKDCLYNINSLYKKLECLRDQENGDG